MNEKLVSDYKKYSTPELFDIYSRIDRLNNLERFNALENELKERTGLESTDLEKQISISKSLKTYKQKKSTHLVVISWIIVIYSGFTLLSSLIGFITSLFIKTSFISTSDLEILPSISKFLIKNMFLIYLPTLVIATAFIFNTIGLFRNKESSRENIVYLLWFSLFWNFVWSIFQIKFITLYIIPNNIFNNSQMNFMKTGTVISSIVSNLFLGLIIGYIISKLSSNEIKREFS